MTNEETMTNGFARIVLVQLNTDEQLNVREHEAIRVAIKALEQQTCEDAVSREAVKDKLLKLCNELEGIFADIRMKEVDDCVCGLCEYDCDHGIDGSAFECPGFETDECFKLADEIRYEWQNTKDLPPVNPQPKTGWIPVSERLPEKTDRYLAYIVNKNEDKLRYIMTCDYSVDGYWNWFPDDECASDNVIAWMPLPEPYEPQESEVSE